MILCNKFDLYIYVCEHVFVVVVVVLFLFYVCLFVCLLQGLLQEELLDHCHLRRLG